MFFQVLSYPSLTRAIDIVLLVPGLNSALVQTSLKLALIKLHPCHEELHFIFTLSNALLELFEGVERQAVYFFFFFAFQKLFLYFCVGEFEPEGLCRAVLIGHYYNLTIILKRGSIIEITIGVSSFLFPLPSAPLFLFVKDSGVTFELIVFPSSIFIFVAVILMENDPLVVRMISMILVVVIDIRIVSSFLPMLRLPIFKEIALMMNSVCWLLLTVIFAMVGVFLRVSFPELVVRHWPIFVDKAVEVRAFLRRILMLLLVNALHFLEIGLRKVSFNIAYPFSIAQYDSAIAAGVATLPTSFASLVPIIRTQVGDVSRLATFIASLRTAVFIVQSTEAYFALPHIFVDAVLCVVPLFVAFEADFIYITQQVRENSKQRLFFQNCFYSASYESTFFSVFSTSAFLGIIFTCLLATSLRKASLIFISSFCPSTVNVYDRQACSVLLLRGLSSTTISMSGALGLVKDGFIQMRGGVALASREQLNELNLLTGTVSALFTADQAGAVLFVCYRFSTTSMSSQFQDSSELMRLIYQSRSTTLEVGLAFFCFFLAES